MVIEKANHNDSAYLLDAPGCIATGKTIEEAKKNITEAPAMYLKGLVKDGISPPEPKTKADYVVE